MMQTLWRHPYDEHRRRFLLQWTRSISPQRLSIVAKVGAAVAKDGGKLMRISHNVLLTHEDKTYSGAFSASASIPWGVLGRETRTWAATTWCGRATWCRPQLLCSRPDGRIQRCALWCTWPVRSAPTAALRRIFGSTGTPYWTGIQLDEVAFPIILAWRLWKQDGLGEFDIFPFVERAAAFLVRYAPVTQQERWEETAGYSPSTLAAVISALVCAADIARSRQSSELAAYLETYADWIEAHLDEWTTTTEGVLLPEVKYHYMRIRPPCEGEPFYNPQLPSGWIHINNREPGERCDFEAREVIDAGFLELVRYGIRRADDPLIVDSLKVVDHCLEDRDAVWNCWRRYNHDGYGQKKDGCPYNGSGQGQAWPILTGERAHYELSAGHDYTAYIKAIEQFSSTGGMLPEQIWDYSDIPSKGMYLGRPAGSAQPLVWAHAEYVKLLRSAADGRPFDRISVVEERYGVAGRQADLQEPHRDL